MNSEEQSRAVKCGPEGDAGRCCRRGGRCVIWVVGVIVVLFATFHAGWYAALRYQAAQNLENQGAQQ